jgi:hypothetical protein
VRHAAAGDQSTQARRDGGQGILDALRRDHDQIRRKFALLELATGKRRRDLFQQLVSELIRHEVAEEEILRPVTSLTLARRSPMPG